MPCLQVVLARTGGSDTVGEVAGADWRRGRRQAKEGQGDDDQDPDLAAFWRRRRSLADPADTPNHFTVAPLAGYSLDLRLHHPRRGARRPDMVRVLRSIGGHGEMWQSVAGTHHFLRGAAAYGSSAPMTPAPMSTGPNGTADFRLSRRSPMSTRSTTRARDGRHQEARQQPRDARHQAQAHGELDVTHAQRAAEQPVGDQQHDGRPDACRERTDDGQVLARQQRVHAQHHDHAARTG